MDGEWWIPLDHNGGKDIRHNFNGERERNTQSINQSNSTEYNPEYTILWLLTLVCCSGTYLLFNNISLLV